MHVLQQRIVRLRKDLRRAKKKNRNANKKNNQKIDPDSDPVEAADNATTKDSASTSGNPQEQFGSELLLAGKDEDIAKLAQVCVPFTYMCVGQSLGSLRGFAQISATSMPTSMKEEFQFTIASVPGSKLHHLNRLCIPPPPSHTLACPAPCMCLPQDLSSQITLTKLAEKQAADASESEAKAVQKIASMQKEIEGLREKMQKLLERAGGCWLVSLFVFLSGQ